MFAKVQPLSSTADFQESDAQVGTARRVLEVLVSTGVTIARSNQP